MRQRSRVASTFRPGKKFGFLTLLGVRRRTPTGLAVSRENFLLPRWLLSEKTTAAAAPQPQKRFAGRRLFRKKSSLLPSSSSAALRLRLITASKSRENFPKLGSVNPRLEEGNHKEKCRSSDWLRIDHALSRTATQDLLSYAWH